MVSRRLAASLFCAVNFIHAVLEIVVGVIAARAYFLFLLDAELKGLVRPTP